MFAKVDKNLDSCESWGINKVNACSNWGHRSSTLSFKKIENHLMFSGGGNGFEFSVYPLDKGLPSVRTWEPFIFTQEPVQQRALAQVNRLKL